MTAEITMERCGAADLEYVDFVLRHPSIYSRISDDLTPRAEEISAGALLMNGRAVFLRPLVDGFGAGVFMMHSWNSVTYEVHSCVLPGFRGKTAVEASRLAAAWMFENTDCRKLVTLVPAWNRAAYALAHRVGFRTEGVNRKSFLRNGVLYDQALMGLLKDDWERRACASERAVGDTAAHETAKKKDDWERRASASERAVEDTVANKTAKKKDDWERRVGASERAVGDTVANETAKKKDDWERMEAEAGEKTAGTVKDKEEEICRQQR